MNKAFFFLLVSAMVMGVLLSAAAVIFTLFDVVTTPAMWPKAFSFGIGAIALVAAIFFGATVWAELAVRWPNLAAMGTTAFRVLCLMLLAAAVLHGLFSESGCAWTRYSECQ